MKSFMETQSFTSFLENHSWPTAQLFDEWLATKRFNKSLDEISNPKSGIRTPICSIFYFERNVVWL